MREGDRGWQDMRMIEQRLPELSRTPIQLLWAPGDEVFPIETCNRLKELLPHAEGRSCSIRTGRHFAAGRSRTGSCSRHARISRPFLRRVLP